MVGPRDASTWETSHARERSAEPLTAKSAGSLFEVAWRNASGDPYVTQSRSMLEVRVFLSLSCADSETSNKLAEDWESFKLANKKDKDQKYWASVDVKTTLGPASQSGGRRTFAVSGVPCILGLAYYFAFRVCGLGWLYRLWYSTRNGVVEMHLHRELSIRGFGDEASRTRETDRTAERVGAEGYPPEWETRITNLCDRFPEESRQNIIKVLREFDGHAGHTATKLQKIINGEEGAEVRPGKDATMSAKTATKTAKDATKSAKDERVSGVCSCLVCVCCCCCFFITVVNAPLVLLR